MKNIIFTLNQINKKISLYELLKPTTSFIIIVAGFFISLIMSLSIKLNTLNDFIYMLLTSSVVFLLVTLIIAATILITLISMYMFDIRHILFDKNQLNSKILKIFFPLFFLIGIKKFYSRSDYLDKRCISCKDNLRYKHFTSGYLYYDCSKCNVEFIINLEYNNIEHLTLFINDNYYIMKKYMEDEIPRYLFASSDKCFEQDILTEIKSIDDFFYIMRKYEENIIFL